MTKKQSAVERVKQRLKDKKGKAKGAGSKGGKITGYTKTGNPIYAKRTIAGVAEHKPSGKQLVGKEKLKRQSQTKHHLEGAAAAAPKGQRKKIQNVITKLKHKLTKKALENLMDLVKAAPKGVDPDKHERCVQDVKDQGKDVGSAHAICTASLKGKIKKVINKTKKNKE
jgi:hypothetical protein